MKNGNFTQRKFLNFPIERQHKKCAELLRIFYCQSVQNADMEQELTAYHTLTKWMGIPKQDIQNLKAIANAYHYHLKCAAVHHKEHHLLPSIRKGDKQIALPCWDISIYLDNIRSAHNVGSIIRTVESFSLGKIYFSKNTPFSDNKKVKDTAMGTEQWVSCHANSNLQDLPRPFIVMETADSAVSLFDFTFPDSFTLVVGNEEYGCSEKTLQLADALIEIPLRGHKNSLNAANAFAIAAGEISRQKNFYSQLPSEDHCE